MDSLENICIMSCSGSSVNLRIQFECGKYGPEELSAFHYERNIYIGNPLFDNFDKFSGFNKYF